MLSTLVATYLSQLEAEGKSPKTIDWHRSSLGRFERYLTDHDHDPSPEKWSPTLMRSYLLALRAPKPTTGQVLSPHSVASYANSLRTFCKWLVFEELAEQDALVRVKQPQAPTLVKPTLSSVDTSTVLAAIRGSKRSRYRNEAIVLLLLDTGIRANELCGLKVEDVDWQQRTAKVHGKGGKDRQVPFSATTMRSIQRYMVRERKDTTPFLLQSEEGQHLTLSGLLQLLKRVGAAAGVKVNPHKFRHTFAISYLRNGGNVFALQRTLGHTSLEMTLRYSSLVTDDLVRDHKEFSPVQRLANR